MEGIVANRTESTNPFQSMGYIDSICSVNAWLWSQPVNCRPATVIELISAVARWRQWFQCVCSSSETFIALAGCIGQRGGASAHRFERPECEFHRSGLFKYLPIGDWSTYLC